MVRDQLSVDDASEGEASEATRESSMLRAAMTACVVARGSDPSLDAAEAARVLVADDDSVTRELVANVLRASGYQVETVADGQEAVARFAMGGLDVILLDAVMPRASGVAACRTIKGLRSTDFVAVVLAFAKTDPKSRVEALMSGADSYVCKPFEQTELLLSVANALRLKRAHDRCAHAQRKLERMQDFDEATGVHSFRYLHTHLTGELARAEEHAEPLACFLLDVDRLKMQNERGGRSLGDRVLRGVADVIKGSVRDTDTVARYGGDEFFVLLPATHVTGALVVASRIWRDVGERSFSAPGAEAVHVTASLGIALFPSRDVRTKEAILRALEASLFEAKRRGGNRLCMFQHDGAISSPEIGGV